MNITIISDTHGEHSLLGSLSGDVLIHCGDMFNMYSPRDDDIALKSRLGGNYVERLERASVPTRLKELPAALQHHLINWGYQAADAALQTNGLTGVAGTGLPYPTDYPPTEVNCVARPVEGADSNIQGISCK